MTPERIQQLRSLEAKLAVRFTNLGILDQALTHSSAGNEDWSGQRQDNEALEFLGDAVLGLAIADLLHRADAQGAEGRKSRHRAQLVSARSLAQKASALGLPAFLILGRGEEKTGGRGKAALWANAYESVIAALYLDQGFPAAYDFVRCQFGTEIDAGPTSDDYKSLLQEDLQRRGESPPRYEVVSEEGPSHRPQFRVSCVIAGESRAEGVGFSKKEAQQQAAQKVLEAIQPPPKHKSPS